MIEMLFSVVIFALAAAALGIGVLRGRRAIQGSCGGLNRIPGVESDCGGSCRHPCKNKRGADNTTTE
jgi:uncharacterized protein